MNEYQYHEFVAVDRPLTERRQAELRALFPGAVVTESRLAFTYEGGDVLGDPRRLLADEFDVFLYLAGWGTRRLMLRLPARLLDFETARRYCYAASAIASISAEHVLLDLVSEDMGPPVDRDRAMVPSDAAHAGGSAMDAMASILPVREALAAGDLRVLYLAWLLPVQSLEIDGDDLEPPIPSNLQDLGPSMRAFASFLGIDDLLITVAARASPEPEPLALADAETSLWLEKLPQVVKDAWLLRVLVDEDPHVRGEMLRRFRTDRGVDTVAVPGHRGAGDLLEAADALRRRRERPGGEGETADRTLRAG